MKFRCLLTTILLVISCLNGANAQVKNVVIAAVYGGGSNAGAMYQYDFVELFNSTSSPQTLTNWSVQYSGALSASWQKQTINAVIPAGGYYLIQFSGNAGAPTGAVLPTPDVIGTVNISATTGKVALVKVDADLSGTGIGDSTVVDLVGYGGTASGYEMMPAPVLTSKKCLIRINNGCTDINDNSSDFIASTSYVPHNSASPIHRCDGLPVKLISFEASLINNRAVLNWEVASQIGFKGFEIQESKEGNSFINLSAVKSNSNASGGKYIYQSTEPIVTKEYFRLKLVDNDGSVKYSSVVIVNVKGAINGKLGLYPNPATTNLSLSFLKAIAGATIKITNVEGSLLLVKRIQIGSTEASMDITKLPASLYFISYENNGVRSISKFAKQ